MDLNETLKLTVDWYYDYKNKKDLRNTCIKQINNFMKIVNG